jgi:hypothetical protein
LDATVRAITKAQQPVEQYEDNDGTGAEYEYERFTRLTLILR